MNLGQESTSDILDNINSLKSNNKIQTSSETQQNLNNFINKINESNEHLNLNSKNTVEHIMRQNIDKMEGYLNSKVINIYQRPWNKLEAKLKLKKIIEYYADNVETTNLNQEKSTDIVDLSNKKSSKKKYISALENYTLDEIKGIIKGSNKNRVKVDYNIEKCEIENISVCPP